MPFIELSVTESTNIYAMEQLQANLAAHGTAFFAHHQTAGKGQRGKNWQDEPGKNIAMSVIMDCSFLSIAKPFPFSVMVALACHDLFNKYATDETSIKWPNDLYWRDRKAGGILIETQVRGDQWPAAVVGIGININQTVFPEGLKNPVSLKQVTGKEYDTVAIAKELCACLDKRYAELKKGSFDTMLAYYNSHLFKRGETVRLKTGPVAFYCRVRGVSETGELETTDGPKDVFHFGEVEWMI